MFFVVVVCLVTVSVGWADTQDTAAFRVTMLPSNENPPVDAGAASALAAINVRVTRDAAGNVNAATVTFDVDYTVPVATTFTGLHIHNAVAGVNGPIVIDTGLTAATAVVANPGSGKIFRTVNYASTDTALRFVTGLLAAPENYYVNIHSTVSPGGLMRAQLQRDSATFRPALSPLQENPPLPNVDAEGAALIEVRVNRDASGTIVSGTVVFDVDYRFGSPVDLTGIHIHQGVAGQNGPVVIDSGINSTTRIISGLTRGNVYRIVEIDSSNTQGLQALAALLIDPTLFYVDLHTSANPSGVMRGQLSPNVYAFFNLMTGAEETPPITGSAAANSMTIVRFNRDSTGNITNGVVTFNSVFNMGGPISFTGWHIHNGKFGVPGNVVIDTATRASNPITDDDGIGAASRDVIIDGTNANTLNALKGVIAAPELYYVNMHNSAFPNGVIRAQLARETYHFKTTMTGANETPPNTSDATATGWVTVQISRDGATGLINGGKVTFDVDHAVNGATTFTGLHIHSGTTGVAGPVIIGTDVRSVPSSTGFGNITRTVLIGPADTSQITMLNTLILSPDQAYINLHTTTNPGGLVRSQMAPFTNNIAQVAGGGDWITSVTVRNLSSSVTVSGIADFFQSAGAPMPEGITDPNISFTIPPSGSVTFNIHNRGALITGFGRIYTNGAVSVQSEYAYPAFTTPVRTTTAVGRSATVPVRIGGPEDVGIAVLNLTPATIVVTLRDSLGRAVASSATPAPAGVQLASFVREALPPGFALPFLGNLTIESTGTSGQGQFAITAIQFDSNGMSPVSITTQ